MKRTPAPLLAQLVVLGLVAGAFPPHRASAAEQRPWTHEAGAAPTASAVESDDKPAPEPLDTPSVDPSDRSSPAPPTGSAPAGYWDAHPLAHRALAGATPGEDVALRTRDAKVFRNSDGTYTGIFAPHTHYEVAPGRWEEVDLRFRPAGADDVADRNSVIVRVVGAGVEATDRRPRGSAG